MATKADATNLQKIKAFNQNSGGSGATSQPTPVTPVVSPTSKMSVNDIQLLLADPQTLSKEELLRRQALSTKENLRIAEEEHKKLQDQARADALKQRDAKELLKGEAIGLGSQIAGGAAPVGNWMASKPTYGGIAGILIIIGIFLLAIVPTQPTGKSRLNLIWLTLTGKTHIDYSLTGSGTAAQTGQTSTTTSTPPPLSTQQQQPQDTVQPIQNYSSNMGDVIGGMFGLTNL